MHFNRLFDLLEDLDDFSMEQLQDAIENNSSSPWGASSNQTWYPKAPFSGSNKSDNDMWEYLDLSASLFNLSSSSMEDFMADKKSLGDAKFPGSYGGYGGYGGEEPVEPPPLWYDVMDVNISLCGPHPPPHEFSCAPCEQNIPENFTENMDHPLNCTVKDGNGKKGCYKDCYGHGYCDEHDRCNCDRGWFGEMCDSGCPKGWSGEMCDCCPSGVFDMAGACCKAEPGIRPVLDSEGRCCAKGRLDACGKCDGDGFIIDINGQCCSVRCQHQR
jgi:hypothetical protein